jgi:alpha-galactosidase
MIAALGWTGPWIAEFQRDGKNTLAVRAAMDRTHLLLHPGEQIRSPRVLVLFWKGDRAHGHNLWRRLILSHYSPKPGGKAFTGLICDANWGSWMTADKHIQEINLWGDRQLLMECYWMDAGWTDMSKGWVAHQSQQIPSKALFPNGMRPVSDAARRRGMKFLLWFVPDSVHPGVGIAADHPEWLLKPFSYPPAFGNMVFYGLDYGDPRVNQFMIDHFSRIIAEYGIDVFRQDGLGIWPEDTGPDRSGISQIRYTEGFYAFWDGLLKNHPNLLIDNCGCGGRKLDLETIRRSIILWRSDCQASGDFDPISSQGFNYGLFPWIPLSGAAVPMTRLSAYAFRSAYCPAMVLCWPSGGISDLDKQRWSRVDVNLLRRLLNEYLAVRPYLFGDYYPLTPYSLEQNTWMAWQFDRPDQGQGMVQVFRRGESSYESARFRLHGLDADARYAIVNLDLGDATEATGRELMDSGLPVVLPDRPQAVVITYKKVD